MGQLIELREMFQARRRETERHSLESCIRILEANLDWSIQSYLNSPREERLVRAGRLKKLCELLEYAHHL